MHAPFDFALRTEWRDLTGLNTIAAEWRALAAHATEPNAFYEPAFALAAAPVFGAGVGAVLVWSATGRLLGFFPARRERRYGPFGSVLSGWTHPYAPLGVPLVDRDAADTVVAAWLDHLSRDWSFPDVLILPFLPEAGPFAQAFERVLARRGLTVARFGRHARAYFEPGPDRETYLQRAVSAKIRKELGRKRRRLEETGVVTREAVTAPAAFGPAMTEFLALEASGWKGRVGTAAAMHEPIHKFVAAAMTGLAAEGKARADFVRMDGKPIAAMLLLISGDTAWGWKIAYDETYARFSPAVQLAVDLTQTLVARPEIARADSCAAPDHPMIDHLWRERLPIADCMVALRPGFGFRIARRLETARRNVIAAAKSARGLLRPRSR